MTKAYGNERRDSYPRLMSEEGLLCLGGLMGLTPSFRAGGNGQPLPEAAKVLLPEEIAPDFEADAEFIERELFLGE